MKAIWNGEVIAESNSTKVVENNHYFPPESIKCEYFQSSNTRTVCPWKGKAHYFHLEVAGDKNPDSAWFYPHPNTEASGIKDHIAFWKGVKIQE